MLTAALAAAGHPAPAALRLEFIGAGEPQVEGNTLLPGTVNYYIGHDPARWHSGIPTFAGVRYRQLYPGVDAVFYGNGGAIEHDFLLSPGSDPGLITLAVADADSMTVEAGGDLVVGIGGADFRLKRPRIYQDVAGVRREVAGGYALRPGGQFGFALEAYDRSRPLVIDPVLAFSTYFGGSADDYGYGIAVDHAGDIFVTGATNSNDFPTVNNGIPGPGTDVTCPVTTTPYRVCYDAFVSKLNPAGSALIYSTYVGGLGDDLGKAIAVRLRCGLYRLRSLPHRRPLPGPRGRLGGVHYQDRGSQSGQVPAGVDAIAGQVT